MFSLYVVSKTMGSWIFMNDARLCPDEMVPVSVSSCVWLTVAG
jgi:hypothetical protein